MARGTLNVLTTTRTGLSASYTAAVTDGHAFSNVGENVCIHVKNTAGSQVVITIQVTAVVDGLAVPDLSVTVPATTGEKIIGPFPKALYNQEDDTIFVDYGSIANVSIMAFKMGSTIY